VADPRWTNALLAVAGSLPVLVAVAAVVLAVDLLFGVAAVLAALYAPAAFVLSE
jgi:hypothetical protein